MPVLISILLGFAPMLLFASFINWFDRFEQEPKILLGAVFSWGALFASAIAFFLNTFLGVGIYAITGSESTADFATGSLIAPVVEEVLKGSAVLFVFFVFRKEFDSILDGIIYAAITALGFAATENSFYIYTFGYTVEGWGGLALISFVRIILVGWQHPFYTSFFGIGLALSRLTQSRLVKFSAPLLGLAVAMTTHAFHNTINPYLAQTSGLLGLITGTALDWGAWFFMLCFIIWTILKERKILSDFLKEEISLGNIDSEQYKTSISFSGLLYVSLRGLFSGKFLETTRFYQLCGELAHKKYQFTTFGDEGGNSIIIDKLRTELQQLSHQ